MCPAASRQPGTTFCLVRELFRPGAWQLDPVGGAPPCAAGSYGQHHNPSNADEPSRSKRPGDRGRCRGTTTEHRSSPWAPHQPKLARNSGARTFCSTPKRCNSNGAISMFEIHVGELRATFLRNHNMRRHKGTTKCPKQKTTQAQKTPTSPATTTARSTGALHPIWGAAPVTWRCTRYGALHPLRGGAPDMGRCTRYVALHPNRRGALPTDRVQRPNTQEQTRN